MDTPARPTDAAQAAGAARAATAAKATRTMTPQLLFYVLALIALVFVLGPDTKPPRINRPRS